MKLLLISTAALPSPPERYGGVESLIIDYASVLPKLGVDTTLAAPKGSKPPQGCKLIETIDLRFHRGFGPPEELAYQWYGPLLKEFDLVHDFSHGKVASFADPSLKAVNICWFEPVWFTQERAGQVFPMPHNVLCLSEYQKRQFKRVYRREARFQPTICRDANLYRPGGERVDRFLFVGKMSWHKGCLEAVKFCKRLGVPLDIVGGLGVGDPPFYREEMIAQCDDRQVCFYPNVADEAKIRLMQEAKAVLYPVQFEEAHNMVLVESMLCGTPVIVFDRGAMGELVEHNVTGFVAEDDQQFERFMGCVGELDTRTVRERAVERYSRDKVLSGYMNLYAEAALGAGW